MEKNREILLRGGGWFQIEYKGYPKFGQYAMAFICRSKIRISWFSNGSSVILPFWLCSIVLGIQLRRRMNIRHFFFILGSPSPHPPNLLWAPFVILEWNGGPMPSITNITMVVGNRSSSKLYVWALNFLGIFINYWWDAPANTIILWLQFFYGKAKSPMQNVDWLSNWIYLYLNFIFHLLYSLL